MNEDLIQKFGFSEMYEWSVLPEPNIKFGRFVEFDTKNPDKIKLSTNPENTIGITTINSVIDSDNPEEWSSKNLSNEYGDTYLRNETLAIGNKEYDQNYEMAFIRTKKWNHLIPINNPRYVPNAPYVKRSNRQEWIRVNLIGKCIVEDNGKCVPGEYCTVYKGKVKAKYGTAIPAAKDSEKKYYVLRRLTTKTILILNK